MTGFRCQYMRKQKINEASRALRKLRTCRFWKKYNFLILEVAQKEIILKFHEYFPISPISPITPITPITNPKAQSPKHYQLPTTNYQLPTKRITSCPIFSAGFLYDRRNNFVHLRFRGCKENLS